MTLADEYSPVGPAAFDASGRGTAVTGAGSGIVTEWRSASRECCS
jgi:hypothetical protein